jgi:hypothetical protein
MLEAVSAVCSVLGRVECDDSDEALEMSPSEERVVLADTVANSSLKKLGRPQVQQYQETLGWFTSIM